jgi:hypothetical protein
MWLEDPRNFANIYTDRVEQVITASFIVGTGLLYMPFLFMMWANLVRFKSKIIDGSATIVEFWIIRGLNFVRPVEFFVLVSLLCWFVAFWHAYNLFSGTHPCTWPIKVNSSLAKVVDCKAYWKEQK